MNRKKELFLEGNNGGDSFHATIKDDGRVCLQIAHCCVYTVDHIVPVEWLSTAITKAVLESGGVEEIIKKSGWPKDFIDKLCAKIEPMRMA